MSEIGTNDSTIRDHHPIGASTGFMWDLRGDWNAQIATASKISTDAVELSALGEEEVLPLIEFLEATPPLDFSFMSIHGPAKGRRLSERDLVELLARLIPLCNGIVMHPDTMGELAAFEPLGSKLLVENMDSRKPSGRTVEELGEVFDQLPEARLCFDIAHAWSVDPSMNVANEILDAFGERLSHVHLSSLSQELHHVELTESSEVTYAPVLRRCLGVPWILEAPPRSG